jgi:hypothetical protein
VFDPRHLVPAGRRSAVGEPLRGWVEQNQPVFVVDVLAHGRPDTELESVEPETRPFARLLEAGAGHLDRARAAHQAQCRAAAVQARELAAFAAMRPAVVLDRPDEEVGAAAAASRARRPAVLTPVSEWATDEVMVALGLSADASSRLLADSITLVERLPATLEALSAGTISWAHARMLAEVLAPLADAQARADVEGRLLARAEGRTGFPAAGRGAAGGAAGRRLGCGRPAGRGAADPGSARAPRRGRDGHAVRVDADPGRAGLQVDRGGLRRGVCGPR